MREPIPEPTEILRGMPPLPATILPNVGPFVVSHGYRPEPDSKGRYDCFYVRLNAPTQLPDAGDDRDVYIAFGPTTADAFTALDGLLATEPPAYRAAVATYAQTKDRMNA